MRDMAQIADMWESVKVKQKQNALGDVLQRANDEQITLDKSNTSLPKGQLDTPPLNDKTAPAELPDLDSMPTPNFMNNSSAMKSASAADEKTATAAAAKAAKTPTQTPPEYLSGNAAMPTSAMPPATTAAATPGVAPGTTIWTPDKGLHPAQAGESGMSFGSVAGAIGGALSGGVRYDPNKGLYSPGSVVGQAPSPSPAPAAPANPGLAIFPSAIAGTPPAMQPSAGLDFEQDKKRRENMFAIFPSQR